MIRLYLVQPARMTCELFAAVLREESDIQVVGFSQSCEEAMMHLNKQSCDVVMVDMNLPNNEALSFARTISQTWPNVKVIITGLVKSKAAILRCVEEGVDGYTHEEESLADLVKKIRAAYEDEFVVEPAVASMLMSRVAELKQMTKELYGISTTNVGELFTELTPREWEVLQLIERGLSNQDIAQSLIIETGTVKNHVHNILSKLDVRCREQAATLARQLLADQQGDRTQPDSPKTFALPEMFGQVPHYNVGVKSMHMS